MAKAMTKSQIVATLADKTGLAKKQVKELLEELAGLAYVQATNGFTLPGGGVAIPPPARRSASPPRRR